MKYLKLYENFEFEEDFFLPHREGNETRTFNINVGELGHNDVDEFVRRMQESVRVPQQYLEAPTQVTTNEQLNGLFGSPVAISSRAIQNSDGSMDYLSWDIVGQPPKKSLLNQIKGYISDIYRKWKRAK